jgi:hypothetical protein
MMSDREFSASCIGALSCVKGLCGSTGVFSDVEVGTLESAGVDVSFPADDGFISVCSLDGCEGVDGGAADGIAKLKAGTGGAWVGGLDPREPYRFAMVSARPLRYEEASDDGGSRRGSRAGGVA